MDALELYATAGMMRDGNAERIVLHLFELVKKQQEEIDRLKEQISRLEQTVWPIRNG